MSQPPSGGNEPDLRYYLSVLNRRKRLILGLVVACVALSLVYSNLASKNYEATANVLLDGGRGNSVIQGNTITPVSIDQAVGLESRLMGSSSVEDAITEELGYLPDVSVIVPEDSVASLGVRASATSAEAAATEANDFAKTFIAVREAQIQAELKEVIDRINDQRQSLDKQNAELQLEAQELGKQIDATNDPTERAELQFRKERVEWEFSNGVIAQQLTDLRARQAQFQDALSQSQTRGDYTLAPTDVPTSPVSPKPLLNAIIALVTGLLLGIAIAFARDYLDDSIATKEALDDVTGSIPVLSLVPALKEWRRRDEAVLETVEHPNSPVSEAYRNLRTSLDFAALDRKISLVHVTSTMTGEGKTTTAANLAVSVARADRRVILVDCDLRRPRLHEFFGLENDKGFTSVLLGETSVQEALQRPEHAPNLLVLTSGPPPPNPSELLSTKAAADLLRVLTEPADMVIIDSPPLLPVTDSTVLARYAHATILVVAASSTTKRSLRRSLEMLAQIDAPLEGIVLNGIGHDAMYIGSYGYGYTSYTERP